MDELTVQDQLKIRHLEHLIQTRAFQKAIDGDALSRLINLSAEIGLALCGQRSLLLEYERALGQMTLCFDPREAYLQGVIDQAQNKPESEGFKSFVFSAMGSQARRELEAAAQTLYNAICELLGDHSPLMDFTENYRRFFPIDEQIEEFYFAGYRSKVFKVYGK